MSTMTTSAPSRAQVTACARPCPRDPPVIRATLPSSIPMLKPFLFGIKNSDLAAGVDHMGDTGDVPAGVADQVEHGVGDVGRLDRDDRELVQRPRGHGGVVVGGG